jgi:TonB family protein
MNTPLLLDNLVAWSAQVFILVMAAATATFALRAARPRLYFWQAILAAVVILPLTALWNRPTIVPVEYVLSAAPAPTAVSLNPPAAAPAWRMEPVLGLLALGAALRLLWIAGGLLRLARIRRTAQTLHKPPVAFRGNIRWYVSDQISGPVTFGWLRPSILLPAPVQELPPGMLEAIASHELCHVDRGDWLFVMGEELIRSLLWFHPAVWFVLSQIQLAREQVVDQEVVRTTRDRAGYLDALMAVAAQKLQPDVAPAPLFLKKRQLAVRVAALLKETSMSASRFTAQVAGAASFAVLGLCVALWFFPMKSSAQVAQDDPGITVEPGAALAHRAPVRYPAGTIATGDVLLEISLNAKGEVADARVVSGPDDLRKAALSSVLEWHYLADTAPPSLVRATIHFGQRATVTVASAGLTAPPPPPPPPPPPTPPPPPGAAGAAGGRGGRGLVAPAPPPPPPAPPELSQVQRIEFVGLSPELQQRVQNRLTVRESDTIRAADFTRVRGEVQQIDEHLILSMRLAGPYDAQRSDVILQIALPAGGGGPLLPYAAPLLPVAPALPPGVYRIGGGVSAPVPVSRTEPEYSEEARAAKWQGTVLLQVVVNENGVPQNIAVIRPLGLGLDQKAIEAVQKWRFQPGVKDDKPVPVVANIEVSFRLLNPPAQAAAAGGQETVTVGSGVMDGRLIQRVPPVYPASAKTARIQGPVQLNVLIGTDGKVQNASVASGPALLAQAAIEAVSQWVYQPYKLNGQPVAVMSTVVVNFVLQ